MSHALSEYLMCVLGNKFDWIRNDVAPCGGCRPWIFFINGVLCFLKINGRRMEKEER